MTEFAIHAEALDKRIGQTQALDGFYLKVHQGEVHGLLGPNGAGKSTTIRILLGIMKKDDGPLTVLGQDPWHDAVTLHERIAYVPDDVHLWKKLTGGETIDLLGKLRGGIDPDKRDELIQRFNLDPTKKNGTYSRGNRQKVAIIAAFASNVDLYLLDEPTTGLDPLMVAQLRDCIREARNEGATVLLSSHIFADVEALCDRITIIKDGQRVESGTLDELRHLTRTTITTKTQHPTEALADLEGIHAFELHDDKARFEVEPQHLNDALEHLTQLGVETITSHPPTLEDLFMRHYETHEPETEEPA